MDRIESCSANLSEISARRHNPSRGRRAASYLTDALIEALEATFRNRKGWWEVLEIDFDEGKEPVRSAQGSAGNGAAG